MKSEFGLYLHVEHRNPASMHKCGDIVGVVLAGGRSRRFGSDKAEALFEGDRLVDRAIALLSTQLSTIIVSTNRELNVPVTQIADKSATFEGPLAGILAAMAWTREQDAGYSGILTIPLTCQSSLRIWLKV